MMNGRGPMIWTSMLRSSMYWTWLVRHALLEVLVPQGPRSLGIWAHEHALRLGRVGRHEARRGGAVSVGSRYVTVDVEYFLTVVHV